MTPTLLLLALLGGSPASAKPPPDVAAADAQLQAELLRQRDMMEKRAQKGAWAGVERAYAEMVATGAPLAATDHVLGAEAARNMGDIWKAYQRMVVALQLDEGLQETHDAMKTYRSSFGRLTVRRVEATGIALAKDSAPFTPDERAAVAFATKRLAETGGFDGMVPVGTYTLGGRTIEVLPGLTPLKVQREVGDGS